MSYIKSPINYIGNKYRLLPQIIPLFPDKISTFVDLFGGSGTVLLNSKSDHYIYNDINPYISDILNGIREEDMANIFSSIDSLIKKYSLSKSNTVGFNELRDFYNGGGNNWKVLYTLICYSFNYQFRFNNSGKYNSSFGKNRSCFNDNLIKNLKLSKDRLNSIDITFKSGSFETFDFSDFDGNDFIYCDPPYFGTVGNYNDGKRGFEGWNDKHEDKLLQLLDDLDDKNIRWALSNNLLPNSKLVEWSKKYKVYNLNHAYGNCNYQKKDKSSKDVEVLIINY